MIHKNLHKIILAIKQVAGKKKCVLHRGMGWYMIQKGILCFRRLLLFWDFSKSIIFLKSGKYYFVDWLRVYDCFFSVRFPWWQILECEILSQSPANIFCSNFFKLDSKIAEVNVCFLHFIPIFISSFSDKVNITHSS